MKIVFLGTKGEIDKENSNHRNHSSILVISNSGQKLLVDVGVDRDWKIENIKPDYIVITHSHKDHIGGLKEEDPNCDIYATRLTFDTCTPSWIEHFKKENRLKILESEQTNTLGDFKITPIPVLHSVKHPMDILLIEVDNKRIIYAPDMRWIKKDKQEKYLKNIDVWIGDTSTIDKSITRRDKDTGEIYGHLSVRELLDILEENDIRHLILTHLGEEAVGMGDRELKEKIEDLVGDRDIKITVARDKMEISSKDLTVTTEDIITPKKIADIPEYTAGYILVSPHGTLIMKGEKTLVIKSKKYTEHINEPLLLIEDKKALGIIRLDEPEEITQEQFKQLREYHKITDEEADRWSFSKKDKLYSYHVSVLKQFSTPISVEYPRGAQVFIKPENIVLDLTLEDLILEHAKIHSKEEITDEDIEYHNYLVECFNRLEIPHPKGMRDTSYCILDRVDLIQDIGKYDPKKIDDLPLRDDYRIVMAWYSSLKRGKKIHVNEYDKRIELTPEKCIEFQSKIVEEIYKRVKAGKLKHTFRPKEMKKYARELYEKVKERLKKKGIDLEEIEELAEWSIEKIDDRLVRSLSDKDLISLHDWLHEVANRELEEKGRISEETINAHIFVWKEMLERNIPHTIKDKLDRESELIVVEYPSPPKGLEKDKITLKEVLDAFPNTFTINDPPAHIFLVGRIVNEGEIPVDHDIDIVIKQRYPDPRLIKELERVLPDWLFKRLHFIYSPHGAMVGYNIPLYKLSYTRVSRDESLSKEKKITVGKPFKPMKTGTTFNKNEFFDPVMLWKNWGSEYIDDGIVIQPKYDGFRLQIHRAGDKIWIFTEDQLRDRAKYFKESVREMLQKFPEKDYIIDTELVDYPSECAEKYKTGKEIEQKCEQYQREDMIKWIVAKKGLDDRNVVFHIHDILYYDGEQLTDKPYIERLNLLKKLVPKGLRHWSLVESWIARDKDEFEEYLDKARYYPNSEGAMLKTANSTYKISYKTTPRTDLWCITGGSYLLTPKGFRKVKDLKIGDLVYSKDGKPHRIVAIQKRRMLPEERLFEVRTLSGLAIRLTGNHELLTTDSWIPVSEIGDRKSLFPKLEIYTEEPPKTLVLSWHGYKKKIECNEDFWRFLGFWVAEGWIGSSKTKEGNKGDIVVCQKDPSVLEKYSKIIERLFNVKPSLYKYKIALLRFWDLPFASWLSQHFLDESDRKTVPLFLAKLDDSKFKAFLEGYLEGDGWIESSSKRVGFSTSSSSLAGRLFLILQYRGFKVSVQKLKPRRGRGYFRFRFLKGEPDLTIKIREIYEKKTVYDLQIEGEDSYITPYLILHNSKIKNVKEIDVMVWKINKTKAGTYNYEAVIRIPPKEKDKWSDKFLVEIDGKWYLHIGRTYNTDVKCKEGDIITVSPIRIRVFKDEEGKKYLTWMFPIFRGKRIDKKEPDGLDTALRIAEAGTHPLSKTEIRIPLQRCPYFDNPEICPLYPLYSEGWRERERRIREQLSVKVETLRFPIRCNLANRYKCVYVKDYYYEYRDITDLPEYIEVSK